MVIVLLMRRSTSVTLNRKDNCSRTDPTRYLPNDSRNLICTTQYEYISAFCVNITRCHPAARWTVMHMMLGDVLSSCTIRCIILPSLDIIQVLIPRRRPL
jgi:hypothetical protein